MSAPVLDQLQSALGSSYAIERELGRGGMATIYLARDLKHQRLVALKVLHPELAATLGPTRFRREIWTAAQLQHPHILGVHDSGETAAGQLWFTMPYVEGESLRDRLRRERQLPVDDAVRITREVASALAYAHARGVLHRDVKPENILLTREGDALLADFGIARSLGGVASADALTVPGIAVGTPQYMSPEQASGEQLLDGRSDVYSLGAVMYEMLAGVPPFTGPTVQVITAKILSSEAPSVRRSRRSVPAKVDLTLQRALASAPADRWSSASEFAHGLESAGRSSSTAWLTGWPRFVPAIVLAVGLGVVVGVGVLFAWRMKGSAARPTSPSGVVRLAVLPFDNVGDSADSYFADGMTEAVRDKLTSLPGLEVIGSASSRQYRGTTKSPQQIGRELGVRYLLEGRVRWAKGPGGTSRVRVNPELVDVGSAADKWAQPFDAPLTDVFQVQGDIASKVARALQVALTPATQQLFAARPTSDLVAYDAYLRGRSFALATAPIALRRAIAALREAVTRDSAFALAWSRLGAAYALLYYNGVALPALGDSADQATTRALSLAPNLPQAHVARAAYFYLVRNDYIQALREAEAGLANGPNSTLLRTAASAEQGLGRWDEAAAHAAQAATLDPRDPAAFETVAQIALRQRHNAEAQKAYDQSLLLAPDNELSIEGRAEVALQLGNLASARAVLRAAPPTVDPAALVAYMAQYDDLGWVLDSSQQARLLTLRPDAFDGDTATWSIALAQEYNLRGDRPRLLAYADTARRAFASQVRESPDDAQRHVLLGLALAYGGHGREAIREGERAVALRPTRVDAPDGPYYEHQLARIYLITGHPERALDLLERVLKEPYFITPAWLKIDPNFAPLRGNPRFERLIAGGERPVA